MGNISTATSQGVVAWRHKSHDQLKDLSSQFHSQIPPASTTYAFSVHTHIETERLGLERTLTSCKFHIYPQFIPVEAEGNKPFHKAHQSPIPSQLPLYLSGIAAQPHDKLPSSTKNQLCSSSPRLYPHAHHPSKYLPVKPLKNTARCWRMDEGHIPTWNACRFNAGSSTSRYWHNFVIKQGFLLETFT